MVKQRLFMKSQLIGISRKRQYEYYRDKLLSFKEKQ